MVDMGNEGLIYTFRFQHLFDKVLQKKLDTLGMKGVVN